MEFVYVAGGDMRRAVNALQVAATTRVVEGANERVQIENLFAKVDLMGQELKKGQGVTVRAAWHTRGSGPDAEQVARPGSEAGGRALQTTLRRRFTRFSARSLLSGSKPLRASLEVLDLGVTEQVWVFC